MVEVFKTNVKCPDEAGRLLKKLEACFPMHRINFDLADCDNILRVEGDNIRTGAIIRLMGESAYECAVLD